MEWHSQPLQILILYSLMISAKRHRACRKFGVELGLSSGSEAVDARDDV